MVADKQSSTPGSFLPMLSVETLELLDTEFKSFLIERVDRVDQATPLEIVHYTSADAALSILKTQSLSASDIFSMNDEQEMAYGIEVIGKRLQSCLLIPPEIRALFMPSCGRRYNPFMERANNWPAYITCFSTEAHLSSQWERYADKAAGVAIVFHTQHLHACARNAGECSLFPMIYSGQAQIDVADRVAQLCETHARDIRGSACKTEYWLRGLADLAIASLRFKDPRWANEHEWRFFWLNPNIAPKERPDRSGRYVEIGFTPDAIATVILGSNVRSQKEESIRAILASEEYRQVHINQVATQSG
jgi:hypothetical protein